MTLTAVPRTQTALLDALKGLFGDLPVEQDEQDGSVTFSLCALLDPPTPADLLSLLVGEDVLPDELARLLDPEIHRLEVRIESDGALAFAMAMSWPGEWTVIPELLAVADPGLSTSLTRRPDVSDLLDGADDATASGGAVWAKELAIGGDVLLFGLRFRARADLVRMLMSLELVDQPTLRPLLEALHLGGSPFDDVTITRGRVDAAPRLGSLAFGISAGGLEVALGDGATFRLNDLSLDLRYQSGVPSSVSTAVSTSFGFEVGAQSVLFDLSAEREGPDTGWVLQGATTLSPPLGLLDLASSLSTKLGGGSFDSPVDVEIASIALSYRTASRDLTFHVAGALDLVGTTLPLQIDLATLHGTDGTTTRKVSGTLDLPVGDGAPLRFAAAFESATGATTDETLFGAALSDEAGVKVGLGDLVCAVASEAEGARSGLNALSFTLHRAGFAMLRSKQAGAAAPSRYLFKADVDGGVDLSALPLVGDRLPAAMRLSLELAPLYVKGPFSAAELARISALVPTLGDISGATVDGLQVELALKVGDKRFTIDPAKRSAAGLPQDASALLPAKGGSVQPVPAPPASAVPRDVPKVTWIDVQKRLGPISLQRVGLGFTLSDQQITVLLDASLGLAGLEFSLMGLGASYAIATRALTFHLEGLGLSFTKGPISISGAFLRLGEDNYVGEARLQVAAWSLGALGAYSKINGKTSVFIYAFLNAPLGGPAFFFVEGLSFGFGYNRDLIVPPVTQIYAFPLVSEVMGTAPPAPVGLGEGRGASLEAKLRAIDAYVRPTEGQHFIAAGLKFSSFKLLKCFAMVAVSFGEQFKVDVMGVATLEHPPESPVKLAFIELAFAIKIHPDEGFIGVEAALTERSFVYTSSCHLTGGAAFYAWTKTGTWQGASVKAGDFVLTVGGYHPKYQVPAHYPRVAPLGLNWQVTSGLWVKGGVYFALTPDAVMAGGRLQAHFDVGKLTADFLLAIDFLMYWKPFHFEGSIFIELRVAFDAGLFTIRTSLGAELEVWGPGATPSSPQLSGYAKLHIGPFSVGFSFGERKLPPPPISWDAFRQSFVPEAPTGTRVAEGIVRTLPLDPSNADSHEKRYVINPKRFAVETHSVVPLTAMPTGVEVVIPGGVSAPTGLRLPPMCGGLTVATLQSTQTLALAAPPGSGLDHFIAEPVQQGFPRALWGGGDGVLDGTAGVRLTPKHAPEAGSSRSLKVSALDYETTNVDLVAPGAPTPNRWAAPPPADRSAADGRAARLAGQAALSGALSAAAATAQRSALAAAFGLDAPELDAGRLAASYIELPDATTSTGPGGAP